MAAQHGRKENGRVTSNGDAGRAILLALSRVRVCNPLGDYDPFAGAPLEQVSYRCASPKHGSSPAHA